MNCGKQKIKSLGLFSVYKEIIIQSYTIILIK